MNPLRVWVIVLVFMNLESQSQEEFSIAIVQLQWVEKLSAPLKRSQGSLVSSFPFCQGQLMKHIGATPDTVSTFQPLGYYFEWVEVSQVPLTCARSTKGTAMATKRYSISHHFVLSCFWWPDQGSPSHQICWGSWWPQWWPGSKGVCIIV